MTALPGPSLPAPLQLSQWVFRPIQFMQESRRRYGRCYTMRFPKYPPIVICSDPEMIREIFTMKPEEAHAGEGNMLLEPLVGKNSLLLLDEEKHLRERKQMTPPFHGERMQAYGPLMRSLTNDAISHWPMGVPFSIHDEMQKITLEVILRAVFGLSEGPVMTQLRELLTELLDRGSHPMMLLLQIALPPEKLKELFELGINPLQLGPARVDLGPVLPWSKVARLMREVDTVLFEEIARRRASQEKGQDILSLLLTMHDGDDQALRDEMITLLAAGHETTATSLAWTIHHVLAHPYVIERIEAERQRLPHDVSVQKLEYLDAVIKESMRMTPIVPVVARRLTQTRMVGRQEFEAGTVMMPCIYLTHHDPEIWTLPQKFYPERFLGHSPSPFEFFPFGGGVRRCLGAAFALFEMKIVLREIFARCTFERLCNKPTNIVRRGITFMPEDGVKVILQHRKPLAA